MSSAKRTLCIVNPYEHGGGAEYQISLLIDALVASGRYDVHYLAHFLDSRERTRHYAAVRIGGGGPIPRFGYLSDSPALWGALRRIGPDVIYQRVACAYTGICAGYSRVRSVPLVWHVAHDTDVSPAILDPARNLVRVRLEKWAVNFGARYATRVVVQTRHQAGLLEANFGRAPDAIIPNFHPVAHEALDKTGPTTVVWVANLKPWKRPDAFIRLAAALSDLHDVRFVMIGAPGSSRWQEDLAKRIDATPNLVYLGEKTQAEVNELLARSTLFVNTSAHEGFPNTFIQSWLRDVAVVSLDVDPDGVLEKSQVGIVAKSESALAGAVRELLEQTSVRAGYVERGRIHAAAMHSLRNIADLVGLIDRCGDRANG